MDEYHATWVTLPCHHAVPPLSICRESVSVMGEQSEGLCP